MLDLLIRGGEVVDGTGGAAQRLDVGVLDGHVVLVDRVDDDCHALLEIDATGAIVCPGFVDVHSHSDLALLADPLAGPKLAQGITTEVIGNCGWGAAPVTPSRVAAWQQASVGVLGDIGTPWTWTSTGEYLDVLRSRRPGPNVATLVPHGAVRHAVKGMAGGPSSAAETSEMCDLLDRGLAEGAIGLSAGLVYPPGVFADSAELEALARVAARRGGVFTVHLRSYGRSIAPALEEALGIALRADVPLQVSHLSIIGEANAARLDPVLGRIEAARASGLDVRFDQQPYPAASSTLSLLLPGWVTAGGTANTIERLTDPAKRRKLRMTWAGEESGDPFWENYVGHCGWERILIGATSSPLPDGGGLEGRSIADIAAEQHQEPAEAAIDLWVTHQGEVTITLLDLFPSPTIERIFRHPLGMVATDAVVCKGLPHPRLYGTSARVLETFVRERRLVPLETAIHKMTGMPAEHFGLQGRGILRPGNAADLVVFDPDQIRDTATYHAPRASPEGIHHVFVNGRRAGGAGTGEVLQRTNAAVSA
jgi:N-acyl-D-aspartate/D-glutamate deacylase